MSWAWEGLIKLYDKLVADGDPVCPIAHTYITAHIGVLVDPEGNFLCAMDSKAKGELVAVPCTIDSEGRTSGAAPHLISDQLQYVGNISGYDQKHIKYLKQLKTYIDITNDLYARAVYKYISKNTLMDDIKKYLDNIKVIPKSKVNIIFGVYGINDTGADPDWTKYYLSTLPQNGICAATGKRDYIPDNYQAGILSVSGQERLFLKGCNVGYIASQKIVHALQYMLYAASNRQRVEAEYNIKDYTNGVKTTDDLKNWINKNYPGKWDDFIKILEGGND